ncbi:MAG: AmmeMemoRadiSam system protein A [Candidatus Omnitrophica bacterium]|nr:AmmeMemoRadiSam system protein A [Candidatus Omnitrophota bacterium]
MKNNNLFQCSPGLFIRFQCYAFFGIISFSLLMTHFSFADESASPLTQLQKKRLVEIARMTIHDYITNSTTYDFDEVDNRLLVEEGVFVTLHRKGQLRGCIGQVIGNGPLSYLVRDVAISAATKDPRFPPVKERELPELDVEVSVLSKPWPVYSIEDIELGTHGVIVKQGRFRQGLFLPQVATETGWSKEEFMSQLCAQKAGLPRDCWKDASTQMFVFTADVFDEDDVGLSP